jgi:anti-anti-sigma factor
MAATITEKREGVLIVKFVDAELSDEMRIREVGDELVAYLGDSTLRQMLLDFDGVSFMSSAMLGQIAMLTKRCMTGQVSLKLCHVAETVREVLRIVRLDTLATIVPDEEAAFAEFRKERGHGAGAASADDSDELLQADAYQGSAEAGDAAAQFCLGRCYEGGKGVDQDFSEAIAWYRKAAEQGYADAQNALANAYAYGIHLAQDYDQAVGWYVKAAEQGHADAQYAMGMNFGYGIGVEQDNDQAVKWYRLAADQGHPKAVEALEQL